MSRFSSFPRWFLTVSPLVLIAGCAYMVESSNQDITFKTPGAHDAKCFAYIDKLKYSVFPPQTMNVKKSPKDMEVVCNAPGNRKVELSVPAKFTARAIWGGPPGVAWDYASESLYHYPSEIIIDFTGVELKPNPLPQHNNPDIKQPEEYDLEEFLPSTPRLNSDRDQDVPPLRKRGEEDIWNEEGDAQDTGQDEENTGEPDNKPLNKGDLVSIIESLTAEEGGVTDTQEGGGEQDVQNPTGSESPSMPENLEPESGSDQGGTSTELQEHSVETQAESGPVQLVPDQ